MSLLINKYEKQNIKIINEKLFMGITEIFYNQGNSAKLIFSDGTSYNSSCINCKNPRCINGNDNLDRFEKLSFPHYIGKTICPTDAIRQHDGVIALHEDKCIHCGLCIVECPIGALYFDNNGKVQICKESDLNVEKVYKPDIQLQQINKILSLNSIGNLINKKNIINQLELIYNLIDNINLKAPELINIFIRNILRNIGINAWIARPGDVYHRMDGLIEFNNKIGVLEVEFGSDSLSVSRRILDSLAMLSYKYNINSDLAIAIFKELPNNRQEYWQVVTDISNTLNIEIKTITLGYLLNSLWNLEKINILNDKYFLSTQNKNLNDLNIENLGILKPKK